MSTEILREFCKPPRFRSATAASILVPKHHIPTLPAVPIAVAALLLADACRRLPRMRRRPSGGLPVGMRRAAAAPLLPAEDDVATAGAVPVALPPRHRGRRRRHRRHRLLRVPCQAQSRCRCGSCEPSPGADVGSRERSPGASTQGQASRGADVRGVRSSLRAMRLPCLRSGRGCRRSG